ncbi:MAG: serine/threonine-protein kinase [Gemmatimonadales bacterium]
MTVRFRLANDTASSLRSETDLAAQLQRRLRAIAALWAAVNLCLSVIGVALEASFGARNPRLALGQLFTASPYFGWFLLVGTVHAIVAWSLAHQSRWTLRALRWLEWAVIAPAAALFVAVTVVSLGGMLTMAPSLAIILAMGMATPWVGMMVVYGVFLPNTWKRCAVGVSLLAVAAILPDVVIAPSAGLDALHLWLYIAAKMAALLGAAAFAIYGAYRVEELEQGAREAQQLGQYVLGELLGSGGMGEVYLAQQTFLRRPCAVKLIRPTHQRDAGTTHRFEREVQATATLTHPNTIQIFDYGHADDGTFYYAMEYLPGLSLEQLVERHGVLAPARAVHLLRQLCGALQEAHGKGLIHRDIKPSNVIICERGGTHDVVKLLDFGIVLPMQPDGSDPRITQDGDVLGTPAFMSPEQCAGREEVGPASDLYSVGVLGCYLLTGEVLFPGRSSIQMLAAHLYEAPRGVSERGAVVSARLDATIARCVAKASSERYSSASDLQEALLQCEEADRWMERDAREWWNGR